MNILAKATVGLLLTVSTSAMASTCIMHQKLKPWFMPSGPTEGQMYYFPVTNVDFFSEPELGLFDVSYTVNGNRQRLCRGDQPCKIDAKASKEWVENMPNDENVIVFSTTFLDSTGEPGWQRNVLIRYPNADYITIAHSTGSGEMALEAPVGSEFAITCSTGG
ncbi:MAG: hypothetical protein ABJL54_16100 [Halioglobus sp.]